MVRFHFPTWDEAYEDYQGLLRQTDPDGRLDGYRFAEACELLAYAAQHLAADAEKDGLDSTPALIVMEQLRNLASQFQNVRLHGGYPPEPHFADVQQLANRLYFRQTIEANDRAAEAAAARLIQKDKQEATAPESAAERSGPENKAGGRKEERRSKILELLPASTAVPLKSISELQQRLARAKSATWADKTLRRDLQALEEGGLVKGMRRTSVGDQRVGEGV